MYRHLAAVLVVIGLSLGLSGPAGASGLEDAKLGLAALLRGDFDQAVLYNTRAIESGELERESLAIAYYNRASGHLRQQHPKLAVADFKRAYETWPEHPLTQQKMRELGLFE